MRGPRVQVAILSGGQEGLVRLWDLRNDKALASQMPEDDVGIRWIDIAADASMAVAGNSSGSMFVWQWPDAAASCSVNALETFSKFKAHEDYILTCRISPDCTRLATTSAQKSCNLAIWALDNASSKTELHGHQRWVWDCAFSSDSAYLVSGMCASHLT